jgi:tetratricopeptide (TPR) repeat protein
VRSRSAPPSFQAYRSYVAGFESFVRKDIPSALCDFERAAAEDSTFVMPAIAAAIMHMNLRQDAAADFVARRVNRFRDEMGPLERATLDMLQGWLRGDNEAAYEAALRQAKIAPGSIGEYQAAEQARVLNRASETVRVLTEMGADRGELRGWFAYWRELTAAHHMLGNHRDELRAARRARELHPGNVRVLFHEIQALAALGQVAAVHERIEERLASPSRHWPSPGALMAAAARELRAHGRPEPAEALFERSLAWYRAQSTAGDRATDYRPSIATVLYDSGRWQDAGALFTQLAADAPENVEYQGYLGVLAARSNDRAAAQRVAAGLRDLEQPYLHRLAKGDELQIARAARVRIARRRTAHPAPPDSVVRRSFHGIVDQYPLPVSLAELLPEALVHRVDLIGLLRGIVREDQRQRIRIAPLYDRAIRGRRHADPAVLDRLDPAQRLEASHESSLLFRAQVRPQPEVHRVHEPAGRGPGGVVPDRAARCLRLQRDSRRRADRQQQQSEESSTKTHGHTRVPPGDSSSPSNLRTEEKYRQEERGTRDSRGRTPAPPRERKPGQATVPRDPPGQVHSSANASTSEPLVLRCATEPALNRQLFLTERRRWRFVLVEAGRRPC